MAAEGSGRQPDVDEEFARIIAGWSEVSSTSGSSLLRPPDAAPGLTEPAAPLPDPGREAEPSGADTQPLSHGAGRPSTGADATDDRADDSTTGAEVAQGASGAAAGSDSSGRDPQPNRTGTDDAEATDSAPAGTGRDHSDSAGHDTSFEAEPPWRGYLPEEPDEHFEPPEPQLPPAHDATYWLAVLGLVGGPLLVLWAVVFSSNPDPGWSVVAGILLTLAGFGLLILRGSGERDPGDDGSRL